MIRGKQFNPDDFLISVTKILVTADIGKKIDKAGKSMLEITAFGMLAEDAGASIEFYRRVLALERVVRVKDCDSMALLRIESPRVEIEQTCIEINDRPNRPYSGYRQKLRLICDLATTADKLAQAGIELSAEQEFTDINGIAWQLSDRQKRFLEAV